MPLSRAARNHLRQHVREILQSAAWIRGIAGETAAGRSQTMPAAERGAAYRSPNSPLRHS